MRRIERRGRPRKARRKVVERVLDVVAIAQAMPHRRAVRAPELRRDARAVTYLGRMRLNNEISEQQYEAGVYVRDVTRRWHAVVGVPRPDRGAFPLDGARVGGGNITDLQAERARRTYRTMWNALRNVLSFTHASHVTAMCAYDEPVTETLDVYRLALDGILYRQGYTKSRECE